MTIRYRYDIEEAQDSGPLGEPYKRVATVFTREEAKAACPLNGNRVPFVAKEELRREIDDLGPYDRWEPLLSGPVELDELYSKKDIDSFLWRVD